MVDREPEQVGTLVVGGGQAGLAVGYHLTRRGVPFLIVDANERIGDAWRNRWDSLRLFTPARYDGLTGMPFPGAGRSFPAKDDVADYLEAYAERFRLPIRGGLRVDALARDGGGYRVSAGDERFGADNVVIALSSFQVPKVPPFASELDPSIVQMHSSTYRNPSQLRDGAVLVVGVGNSGGEISLDVVGSHRTVLAGTEVGHVPVRIDGVVARTVVMPLLFRVVAQHVLTVDTPVGRRMRPKLLAHGAPLVRVKPKDLVAAGVVRVPRIGGVRDGPSGDHGGASPRRGERDLVHGLSDGLLLDRPADHRRW